MDARIDWSISRVVGWLGGLDSERPASPIPHVYHFLGGFGRRSAWSWCVFIRTSHHPHPIHPPSFVPTHPCPQSMSDMLRRRKRLTEGEVQYYLSQLLEALAHLHARGVIHRCVRFGYSYSYSSSSVGLS
jgi:serine/threonine protein kinase